jgi:hypothetical protein
VRAGRWSACAKPEEHGLRGSNAVGELDAQYEVVLALGSSRSPRVRVIHTRAATAWVDCVLFYFILYPSVYTFHIILFSQM